MAQLCSVFAPSLSDFGFRWAVTYFLLLPSHVFPIHVNTLLILLAKCVECPRTPIPEVPFVRDLTRHLRNAITREHMRRIVIEPWQHPAKERVEVQFVGTRIIPGRAIVPELTEYIICCQVSHLYEAGHAAVNKIQTFINTGEA